MTDLLQPSPSARRAGRRAWLSVALTATALIAAAFYLGWREGYFTPVAHFHFEARSSKSLSKGMAVHLSGFKIGQVSNVELLADRSVQVELAIFRPYLDFIRTDCEVRLEAGMPLGDASLEITGGPSRADVAEPGAKLHYRDQPQLFDQIGTVVERLEPIVTNLDALLAQARQPEGELQVSLRNLAEAAAALKAWAPGFMERADGTLAAFKQTSGLANATLTPLAQADGDLQAALRDFHATAAGLRTDLPVLLTDLKALSTSLRASAATLEPTLRELAPKLPALVDEGRRTAAGAGEVVDAAKDLPLIRGKIGQPMPQPLLPTTPP
jgi:ABC-type transporter Mla subunit MlaD